MARRLKTLLFGALIIMFGTLAVVGDPGRYYPLFNVAIPAKLVAATTNESNASPGMVNLTFLFDAHPTLQSCEQFVGKVVQATLAKCASCVVDRLQCAPTLDASQRTRLSEEPLDTPSGQLRNGIVVYSAATPNIALATCRQA